MARTTHLRRGQRRDQPRPILRRQTENRRRKGEEGGFTYIQIWQVTVESCLGGATRVGLPKRNVVNCALKGVQQHWKQQQQQQRNWEKNGTAIVIQLEKLKRLSLLSIFWLLFFSVLSYIFFSYRNVKILSNHLKRGTGTRSVNAC